MKSKVASVLLVGSDSALSAPLEQRFVEEGYEVYSTTRRKDRVGDQNTVYLDLLDPSGNEVLPKVDFALILAGITGEHN